MRLGEIPVFCGLALAFHVAAVLVMAEDGSEAASGGAGGAASVTIAAASPEIAALVEAWETPPDATAVTEAMAEPRAASAPAVPLPTQSFEAAPTSALAPPLLDAPDLPALEPPRPPPPEPTPAADSPAEPPPPGPEVVSEPGVATALRPKERPDSLAVAPSSPAAPASAPPADPSPNRAAEAQSEQRAAGAGSAQAQAGTGQAPTAAAEGERVRLIQSWGAQVQQQLQRALAYPRQAEMQRLGGRATIELTVGRDGRVLGRRLVASSGVAALDEAALQTADRAHGIPPAPRALVGDSFTFQLPVVFQPR